MARLAEKVYRYMQENQMAEPGQKIVLGVSGGPDSVALFYILLEISHFMDLSLAVVHINHGIRGKAADADQIYVENLCEKEAVPCYSFRLDLKRFAKETGMSEEEAGRCYRYQCFEKVRTEISAQKIAVAHQQEDTCETVLLNLFRGTGIRGLAGIPPVRGVIIRPLLGCSRQEIENYLTEKDIDWCTDATNLTELYTRNKIRNKILPYVEETINSSAGRHIQETAGLMRDIADYLDRQSEVAFECCVQCNSPTEYQVDGGAFLELDVVLQREVLRRVVGRIAGKLKDIERKHIEKIRALMEKQVGRSCSLPYQIRAVRTYEGIRIKKEQEQEKNIREAIRIEAAVPGKYKILESGCEIHFDVREINENQEIPVNLYTKWFDYDRIKNSLTVRTRENGDFITLDSQGHRKLLKRWMIDEKIPREDREHILLLADGHHILWIIGYRISDSYKVSSSTKRILIVEIEGEINYGR